MVAIDPSVVLARQILGPTTFDPPTVVVRAHASRWRRNDKRPRLPVDRETAHRILEETIVESSIPIILGSKPLGGAEIWVESGIIHVRRGDTELFLDRTSDRRLIRGKNPRWRVTIECRLVRTTEGWREIYSQLAEYARLEDMEVGAAPIRRQSTRVNEDGGIVSCSSSHAIDEGEDVLRRTVCLTRPDGSRVEEQEETIRVGDVERYDVVRTEYDAEFRPVRSLHYSYPELSPDFYRSIRERILSFEADDGWLDRAREW